MSSRPMQPPERRPLTKDQRTDVLARIVEAILNDPGKQQTEDGKTTGREGESRPAA